MTKASHLLAIDAGTQSVRALVFDRAGHVVARARHMLRPPYESPRPGVAEQDPLVYWQATVEACQALWRGGASAASIAGVALTAQRGTLVCAAEDGTPLRPAIVWPDQRECTAPPPLGAVWSTLFAAAGAAALLRRLQAQAEVNWLAQHEPELVARADRIVLLSSWLAHRLVGDWVDSAACQVGYLPYDYRRQAWAAPSSWHWRALAVRRAQLPRLAPAASSLGTITDASAVALGLPRKLPLIAAAADKACEVLGCNAVAPTTAHLSFGTAATINTTQPRYLEVQRLLPAYPAAVPGEFNTEIQIERGFWLVSWFRQEFGREEERRAAELGVAAETLFDELIASVPAGSMGLVLQPYWSPGLRKPGREAKGAVIGFSDVHTRAHLYRALIEGLAYGLRAGRETIERRLGRRLARLVVSGGGSQSDGTMQITADVFGLAAERPEVHDASALGAAMLCATGLGWHADVRAAAAAMARTGRVFPPDGDAAAVYDRLYREVYRPLYGRLAPLYRRIRAITGHPD